MSTEKYKVRRKRFRLPVKRCSILGRIAAGQEFRTGPLRNCLHSRSLCPRAACVFTHIGPHSVLHLVRLI